MSVSDDLNAAADVLEKDGWIQGDFHQNGAHCALGAIGIAVRELYIGDEVFEHHCASAQALSDFLGLHSTGIGGWNDTPGRTAEEVIQAMRDAATKNQTDEYRSNGVS